MPVLIASFPAMGMAQDWISHQAIATSLATVIGTGAASTISHQRHGAVRWDLFRLLIPGILIGAWLGAGIAGFLPELWLKRLFGLFLLFTGARMLRRPRIGPTAAMPSGLALTAAGVGIGTLSALLGIGGGILTVPILSHYGLQMRRAVATSSACGVPIAVVGTAGFVAFGWGREGLPEYSLGFVYWPAALVILAASVSLAPLGARFAHRLPTHVLKRIFGALLVAVSFRLLLV